MKRFFLLCICTSLFGQENYDRSVYFHEPISEKKPLMEGYNAPARIDVQGSWDIFFFGNFLYWQAREEGLEFCTVVDNQNASPPTVLVTPNFKYKPGFQAGIGYQSKHDHWDLKAFYTWYQSTTKKTVSGNDYTINPKWTPDNTQSSTIQGRWRLSLQMIDVQWGRDFYVGHSLSLRPFIGPSVMWLLQKFQMRSTTISDESLDSLNRSRHWGLGPKGGWDMRWQLGYNFDIFIQTALAIYYSKYKVTNRVQESPDAAFTLLRRTVAYLRPNLDIGTGFQWGFYFSNYRFHWGFYALYDFKMFWNQNIMRQNLDTTLNQFNTDYGDLTFQGLTAGTRFDF
jgi:hypothetical protein